MGKKRLFWQIHDSLDANTLRAQIASAGVFGKVDVAVLPKSIQQQMAGLTECYVSRSMSEPSLRDGLVYGGKLIAARYVIENGQNTGKGYSYAYAISSSNQVLFVELDKDSRYHHWISGSVAPVEQIADRASLPSKVHDPI